MKYPLVGVGAAGIVSTVAFSLFLPGEGARFGIGDILDTSLLLGMAFGAILTVGLAAMAKNLSTREGGPIASKTDWCKTCPSCSTFIRKRRNFCPHCGADLR